jgi:hypothetical protein
MLAAMRGEASDQIPWAPRMDLWYIANRQKGTLPQRFQDMNTVRIAQELNVACHAVRGDFTLPRPNEYMKFRGLGLDNHPDYPYMIELRGLPIRFESDGEEFKTWITTPGGEVFTHIKQTKDMRKDGISLPFVVKFPLNSQQDFEPVAQVFEHLEVIPKPENYAAFRRRVGDQGLAVANGLLSASPIHFMLHDLAAIDTFYYLYTDCRDEMYALAERMKGFFNKLLDAVFACECEAFVWGGNYDQSTTYPAFFEQEIQPWLNAVGRRAAEKGKFCVCHTDGENRGLLEAYRATDFHVAESLCTLPMTSCSLKEFREGVGSRITTWGGIPAVALIESSMNDRAFEAHLDTVFSELGAGERLIFGVSDNVPPEASLRRMERIQKKIQEFGPVQAGK